MVAFQASESGRCWALWRVGMSPRGQIRGEGSLNPQTSTAQPDRRGNLISPSQARAHISGGSPGAQEEEHAGGQLGERGQSQCARARRLGGGGGLLRKPSTSVPPGKTIWGGESFPFPGYFRTQVSHSMKLHCIVLSGGQKGSPGLPLSASPKYGFGKESPRTERAL